MLAAIRHQSLRPLLAATSPGLASSSPLNIQGNSPLTTCSSVTSAGLSTLPWLRSVLYLTIVPRRVLFRPVMRSRTALASLVVSPPTAGKAAAQLRELAVDKRHTKA
jgi:hypothetical protein